MANNLDHSKAINILQKRIPGLEAVYLFGSQVTGNIRTDSDIDIAFLTYEDIDNVERWKIQEEIAIEFKQDVDLVDLRKASEVMQFQVVTYGEVIYSSNESKVNEFQARVAWLYLDLCENRAPIIANIKESGSIYG